MNILKARGGVKAKKLSAQLNAASSLERALRDNGIESTSKKLVLRRLLAKPKGQQSSQKKLDTLQWIKDLETVKRYPLEGFNRLAAQYNAQKPAPKKNNSSKPAVKSSQLNSRTVTKPAAKPAAKPTVTKPATKSIARPAKPVAKPTRPARPTRPATASVKSATKPAAKPTRSSASNTSSRRATRKGSNSSRLRVNKSRTQLQDTQPKNNTVVSLASPKPTAPQFPEAVIHPTDNQKVSSNIPAETNPNDQTLINYQFDSTPETNTESINNLETLETNKDVLNRLNQSAAANEAAFNFEDEPTVPAQDISLNNLSTAQNTSAVEEFYKSLLKLNPNTLLEPLKKIVAPSLLDNDYMEYKPQEFKRDYLTGSGIKNYLDLASYIRAGIEGPNGDKQFALAFINMLLDNMNRGFGAGDSTYVPKKQNEESWYDYIMNHQSEIEKLVKIRNTYGSGWRGTDGDYLDIIKAVNRSSRNLSKPRTILIRQNNSVAVERQNAQSSETSSPSRLSTLSTMSDKDWDAHLNELFNETPVPELINELTNEQSTENQQKLEEDKYEFLKANGSFKEGGKIRLFSKLFRNR